MKPFNILLVGIGLLAMAEQACSQDSPTPGQRKPLNNPMYSTHNYKHPNMAAAARRWEAKEGVAVKAPRLSDAELANYKRQMPIAQPVGGITVEHIPTASQADRNYKIQRVSEPKPLGPPSEYYVKKPKARMDDNTIGQ
ncbi:hypothetical protein [Spirosoma sp.]|uniref:hypothetical protein n=1 Tax=Spirosoma sp. TaxID=1899569 RepID=UPI003B3B309B